MGERHPFFDQPDETPVGVFVGCEPDLLGLPEGLRRAEPPKTLRTGPQGREKLRAAVVALQTAEREAVYAPLPLSDLTAEDRAGVLDLLGVGEVSALITDGESLIQAQESVFPGLWVVRREESPDAPWLEVTDAPLAARAALASMEGRILPLEHIVPPDGAMNVMGVLTEVRHRSRTFTPDTPTHVMNFTLLPMTPADADFLALMLGQGPVRFTSGGYGSARIIATAVKHVFAVQYLNSMGQVILDTIEIGDLPGAACAQAEDFEDSAERLARIVDGGWA